MIPTYLKESYQLFDAALFENNIKYILFTFWRSSSGFYFLLNTGGVMGVVTMQVCTSTSAMLPRGLKIKS